MEDFETKLVRKLMVLKVVRQMTLGLKMIEPVIRLETLAAILVFQKDSLNALGGKFAPGWVTGLLEMDWFQWN